MLAISSSLRHGFINGFVHWGLPFGGLSLRDKEAAAMGDEKTTSPNGRGSEFCFSVPASSIMPEKCATHNHYKLAFSFAAVWICQLAADRPHCKAGG
jgi:hypothetical protein